MKHAHSGVRRSVSSIATVALMAGATAVLATPAPAQAATTITNAELRWELNKESISGAFAPGTWNLFSAGKLGNPGEGAQTLTSADGGATWANGEAAGWKNAAGNVRVLDKASDGTYAPTTWLGTRQNSAGQNSTPGAINSENLLSLTNGTGSVDTVTDTGTLSWAGDFTVVYYSGMSFFYVSNPKLSVTNGTGKVTATLSGYGADMNDPEVWNALPSTEVTLADVTGVDLTATGLSVTPTYLGVDVTPPSGSSPQVTSNTATAGSFPQSFVDFQGGVGTASYWYSSGGAADSRKLTTPLNVGWTQPGQGSVTVSRTTLLPDGAQQVTVQGSGFDPSLATGTRPPLAGQPGGAYVVFGKFADVWRPSAGAPGSSRKVADQKWALPAPQNTDPQVASQAVLLSPDGTFTATLTVDPNSAALAGAAGNFGIYTYAGSGAVQSGYETYTPITFAKAAPGVAITAASSTYGADVPVAVTVSGESAPSGDVVLKDGATTVGTAALVAGKATFTLTRPGAGAHVLTASYAGDVNTEAGEGSRSVTVARAIPNVGVTAADVKSGGDVAVSVTVPAAATGTVVLKEGTDVLGTATVAGGTATFTVADLATGEHALVASYAGDTNHAAASGTTRVTVGQATGTAKVSWATKPTAGKRGTAKVAVSEHATGKATVVLRNAQGKASGKAKGKKIATLRVKIKNGVVTIKLPRLARGTYTLLVKVPGNADVAKATVTRTFRVK